MSLICRLRAPSISQAVARNRIPSTPRTLVRSCGFTSRSDHRSDVDDRPLNQIEYDVHMWARNTTHEWREEDVSLERLRDLWITLPTRRDSVEELEKRRETLVPYGHHLIYCCPRNKEEDLRPDGSDAQFAPPVPSWKRMWASGEMRWPLALKDGLHTTIKTPVGQLTEVTTMEPKGFADGVRPKVFVTQELFWRKKEDSDNMVWEKRTHVYLPPSSGTRRVKRVDVPQKEDFSFEFLPTPTLLFRFSALTFNAHRIHLDKHYAVDLEGYRERLVHGPLTALMLLDVAHMQYPGYPVARVKEFTYRAHNPLVANETIVIKGVWNGDYTIDVWAESAFGTVGMTGKVTLWTDKEVQAAKKLEGSEVTRRKKSVRQSDSKQAVDTQ